MFVIPTFNCQRQGYCNFKAPLVYIPTLTPARTTLQASASKQQKCSFGPWPLLAQKVAQHEPLTYLKHCEVLFWFLMELPNFVHDNTMF